MEIGIVDYLDHEEIKFMVQDRVRLELSRWREKNRDCSAGV